MQWPTSVIIERVPKAVVLCLLVSDRKGADALSRPYKMWWPFQWLVIYVLGGLTFVPLVIALIIGEISLAAIRGKQCC